MTANKCITRDYLKELFHYDPETGVLTRKIDKATTKKGDIAGTLNGCGYLDVRIDSVLYKVHRIAWLIHYGEDANEIDHINGIRTDNRICNLRSVSGLDNMKNKRMYKNNKSGVTGVTRCRGKWHVSIKDKPNHQVHIGVYEDINDAISARKQAELKFNYHVNHGRSENG